MWQATYGQHGQTRTYVIQNLLPRISTMYSSELVGAPSLNRN